MANCEKYLCIHYNSSKCLYFLRNNFYHLLSSSLPSFFFPLCCISLAAWCLQDYYCWVTKAVMICMTTLLCLFSLYLWSFVSFLSHILFPLCFSEMMHWLSAIRTVPFIPPSAKGERAGCTTAVVVRWKLLALHSAATRRKMAMRSALVASLSTSAISTRGTSRSTFMVLFLLHIQKIFIYQLRSDFIRCVASIMKFRLAGMGFILLARLNVEGFLLLLQHLATCSISRPLWWPPYVRFHILSGPTPSVLGHYCSFVVDN